MEREVLFRCRVFYWFGRRFQSLAKPGTIEIQYLTLDELGTDDRGYPLWIKHLLQRRPIALRDLCLVRGVVQDDAPGAFNIL